MLDSLYFNFKGAFKIITEFPIEDHQESRRGAIYYENLGWIHLLAEEYQPALEALQQGLSISLEIAPKSDLVSQIKRRIADAYFGLKQYDKAKQFADEALQVSEHLNERVEIAACWRVFAQLDAIAGKEQSAREWFAKAIEMFAMIESNYDLAVTRYTAATSGLYRNGERQALLYMARKYFETEEVAYFVEKVDRELPGHKVAAPPAGSTKTPMIAVSKTMKDNLEMAANIANSPMSILLLGPTGTGKDQLARYIHELSGLTGDFVSINISAIPNDMIEAELFGHGKGAFTGATGERIGLIEQANGGTLFLNEIADATPQMQAKLLDVLERNSLRRLGENAERTVSFRLLSATNADLKERVGNNLFRPDLYQRLRHVEIHLPPLSERIDDIAPLTEHFLHRADLSVNGNSEAFARLVTGLENRDWPGNVRELKAELEKLIVLCERDIAKMADRVMADYVPERERLAALLERHAWNRSAVARELGIGESSVRSKINRYGLAPNSHLREE
ncbi:MAG: sigma 54-interacting transcriptional regulator [Candidatus Zixiibacteriota bacterium]